MTRGPRMVPQGETELEGICLKNQNGVRLRRIVLIVNLPRSPGVCDERRQDWMTERDAVLRYLNSRGSAGNFLGRSSNDAEFGLTNASALGEVRYAIW